MIRKSLKTNNLTIAIILKHKILNHLKLHKLLPTIHFTFFESKNTEIVKDFEICNLLEQIENRVKKVLEIKEPAPIKKIPIDKRTLKDYSDEFIIDKALTTSKKTMYKYKQVVEYLHIFFGRKCNVTELNYKDAFAFRAFLFAVPHHWKYNLEIKDKDLKKLIKKKSKLLEGLPTINVNTVVEIIKRTKTIFRSFENHDYISKSYFSNLDGIKSKKGIVREYKAPELKAIFTYCLREDKREDYNFIKFLLYSGLRRSECLNLEIKHINLDECMIDVNGTKTVNSKRICIVHKDIVATIEEQMRDKSEGYLFFDSEVKEMITKPLHRDKAFKNIFDIHEYKIGMRINKHIKVVLGVEIKSELTVHSLRKNYAQTMYMVEGIKELELKTFLGHSVNKSDVTDNHYLRGKRDSKRLKRLVDAADFTELFD